MPSVLDPVELNLRVKCGGFDMQQPRGFGLMSSGVVKREPDQPRLKSRDLVVEINAFGKIQGAQSVRFVGKRFVASERFCLSQQLVGEIKQTLYAVSSRSPRYFELRSRHGRK